ncbi:hypothetical protein MNB_SV-12-1931 [hydrothermal vent metagenome]|uniref:Uncharacterized protein n=1 Tax=hydrothermal vent metagenome TaxID=652676 RepID=A0A1W1CKG7_9ZZZZ
MSILTPKPNQKFNYTTVLDRKFRITHGLTQTQTEIMAYLVMIIQSWKSIIMVDGYFVILTSKIKNDLLFKEKTIEASLTKLKKLGLIETKLVKVDQWSSNENFRGVKITELGQTYNLSHFKPKIQQELIELKEENRDLKLKYDAVVAQSKESENLNQKAIEALKKEEEQNEKIMLLEHELKETKEKLEIIMQKENQNSTTKEEKEKDLEDFRKKIIKQYSNTGEPICNCVSNQDSWAKDVQFHINSYNRVSIYTGKGVFKQIAEPKQIANFWEWLFAHQHRVGKLLDTNRVVDISHLLKFEGQSIVINKNIYKIYKLTPLIGGLRVQFQDKEGNIQTIKSGFGSEVVDVGKFEDWMGVVMKV